MVKIYGIPNCDTMKKARKWLEANGVEYEFHDFKKLGLDENRLRGWVKELGWETLLNRRGMIWRKLSDEVKNNIDEASAIRVMLETPSIIKRPVLDLGDHRIVGYSEKQYSELF
ncbi:ArsC family reductase [Solemya velesiana gill symbiont]|uniref:Arsenate reductase n=1 Tax=Solemya velesiana gill symbiont TaxID=1918948 RepID=A0A1T2KPG6_9GAMM|nr:ArsC family reductase [Solemya velesiana gill symbiont]OOZ34753.1 arsenate reductase [Solemya velesiana gill symbiont]